MSFFKKLRECFSVWRLKASPSLSEGDAIIAHAGAETATGERAKVNEYLTEIIRELHRQKPRAIIVQGELAEYLVGLPVIIAVPIQRLNEGYMDTVDVTRAFKQICDENGWRLPILVSYQPHLWRGAAVANKLGMNVLIASVPKSIYEPKSSQVWMRSPWLNSPRELIVRILWLIQKKI